MKFSAHFGLNREQPELDFVDIDPTRDTPLFIDPYTISRRDDIFSQACADDIVSFFQTAVDAIRSGEKRRAQILLNNLSEPNDTCLGFSRGSPQGRGVSGKQAIDIYETLEQSRAVRTGFLSELADCELVVEGIAEDKISDITTNIIRRHLVHYTQTQCELHNITLKGRVASGRFWDAERCEWAQDYVALPVISGRRIILVPKALVRWKMALDHQEYYQHFVLNFLQREALDGDSSLVHVLKSGGRRVYKKDLKGAYPLSKDFLFQFSREHPEVLEAYKRSKNDFTPLSDKDFGEVNEVALARGMIARLSELDPGNDQASEFHRLMVGALEFIFYPSLIEPRKEHEIHEGRKRIDITYTNAATDGLFHRALKAPDITAKLVMVECKNYRHDPANPELDQLAGRFSHTRGRLGLLIARRFVDRELFIQRCRDTALDGRGFIVPLDDEDIVAILNMIAKSERKTIDTYVNRRFLSLVS